MEKPTGVIQKIIESLQQVNALDTYSPIEKDIILHNLRAAYMIFLNVRAEEQKEECSVEKLFEKSNDDEMMRRLDDEMVEEEPLMEEEIIEEEPLVEEKIDDEMIEEEPLVEEEIIEEEALVEEKIENVMTRRLDDEVIEEKTSVIVEKPLVDDILEFIPDAKPHSTLLFDDLTIPKSDKKSLNDLLSEKKDDNSLGTRFQQTYIPDLTKAIAINEKFTFIRELFQNSGNNFSNAIQKLNECDNIESAFALMGDLKHQYLWHTTSSAYLSLCDLVRRRFVL
jgi:hypothetical protein